MPVCVTRTVVVRLSTLPTGSANPTTRPAVGFAFLYAILILILSSANTGLTMYGYKYALEDEMHMSAPQMALSNFAITIPLFLSFGVGLLRDRWHPFGLVDRPYLLLSPLIVAGASLLLGTVHRSVPTVLGLLVLINAGAVLGAAAMSAMLALLAKHFGLSGRISVAALVIPNLIGAELMSLTGTLVASGGFSSLCYVSIAFALPVAALALYRPARLFPQDSTPRLTGNGQPGGESTMSDIKRLLASRPALIAALVCFLWDFTPAFGTPLFYYYTQVFHFSPVQYETTNSAGTLGSTLSALSYAFLCFRFSTQKLLKFGVIFAVAGSMSLLLVSSYSSALVASSLMGLTFGITRAGIYDLLYRASPPGLEGVAVSLGLAATYVAGTVGDVLGSFLYERGGFHLALFLTIGTTALILPLIYQVPHAILAVREGRRLD